jgi:hypothetical protein
MSTLLLDLKDMIYTYKSCRKQELGRERVEKGAEQTVAEG